MKPETADRLKSKLLDALLVSMVLASVTGLIYSFMHH